MTTRTITITDDAYRLLASRKEANESFSETIKRSLGGGSLLDLIGILTPDEGRALKETIRKDRALMNEQLSRKMERFR